MATTVTTAGLTIGASAVAGRTTHLALLNASGTECTSSGYSRQAVTWGTPTSGAVSMSGTVSFSVVSFTVAAIAGYSAITSGTKYLTDDVTPVTFGTGGGTYTVDTATLSLSST